MPVFYTAAAERDKEYESEVFKNFVKRNLEIEGLLHAAIGISGEAGELLDAVKKTWVYGKTLDRENLLEELGDLEWYMAAMRIVLDVSRNEILARNTAKLRLRYPQNYTNAAALARADKL